MAYPRHPLSSPGPAWLASEPHRGPIQLGMLSDNPDPAALLGMLARAVAFGSADRDVMLGAIAEAAQALTNATGAALAIYCDGGFVCRARSGETAPDLGARLSPDSGISGECLRTGSTLRCDDTLNDYRVDSEVCLRLGLRSLAVVPLRGREGPVGILEVFSTRTHAFSMTDTSYLARLADIAEAAQGKARTERLPRPVVENSNPKRLRRLWESLGTNAGE